MSARRKPRATKRTSRALTQADFETIAEDAYREAGHPSDEAISQLQLLGDLTGWDRFVEAPPGTKPPIAITADGRFRIVAEPDGDRCTYVARVLAAWLLERQGYRPTDLDIARLAWCLRIPRRALAGFEDLQVADLSRAFMTSERIMERRLATVVHAKGSRTNRKAGAR